MKVQWLASSEIHSLLPERGEPFEKKDWWEALGEPWGGLVVLDGSMPQALWLLVERRLGPLRLWRQPLAVPYAPLIMQVDPPSYDRLAPILRALARFIRTCWWGGIAGSLPPALSYLPPLWQAGLSPRVRGSFLLETYEPSPALLRKIKQAASLPLCEVLPEVAYSLWQAHCPEGIHPKFVGQLEALTQRPFPWRAWVLGDPPEAVGLFLWGAKRVWYFAGARWGKTPQAMTRLLSTAIIQAITEKKAFDFMGSLLPGVERFFRQFGGLWENRFFLCSPWLRCH